MVAAALLVVAYHLALKLAWPQPWDPDEYFHVAIARMIATSGMPERLEATPFSISGERFVDKELLFHYALAPFAGLSVQQATFWGSAIGVLLVVGAFAWAVWRLRPPVPWLFVLALLSLGTLLPQRLGMCRPHNAEIGFSILLLGMLATRAPLWALAVVSGIFGLSHTSGWMSVGFAVVWGAFDVFRRWERLPRAAAVVGAASGGWLLGQLLHPAFPHNLVLLWLVNVVVPLEASGGGAPELPFIMGTELRPPSAEVLLDQWPAFVLAGLLIYRLLREPEGRTRAVLATSFIAFSFLTAASLLWSRFFELGPPLALLALAMLAATVPARAGRREKQPRRIALLCAAIAATSVWTTYRLDSFDFGRVAATLGMARWLGANAAPGDQVFTVQWADSAPLLYAAPQVRSLTAPDPTYFMRREPRKFRVFIQVLQVRHADPVRAIREHFGARWITLPRHFVRPALSRSLLGSRAVRRAYVDPYYHVLEILPPAAAPPSPGQR